LFDGWIRAYTPAARGGSRPGTWRSEGFIVSRARGGDGDVDNWGGLPVLKGFGEGIGGKVEIEVRDSEEEGV